MTFRVDLDSFRGPLDLLLYLVRKHEVDILDIPIAAITEQFLAYIEVLKQIDVNAVSDFVAMAAMLIEIKSREALPRGDEIVEEVDDPKEELVRRLIEYKEFRDAASVLEEQSRQWQQQYRRLANDLPPRSRNLADEPIHDVELWDLVSAFGRILRESVAVQPSSIVYDDTPIHIHMQRIYKRLIEQGQLQFSDMFEPGMHKSSLVGLFLATLELVRHRHIWVEQNALFGDIWLVPTNREKKNVDFSDADNYGLVADDDEDDNVTTENDANQNEK